MNRTWMMGLLLAVGMQAAPLPANEIRERIADLGHEKYAVREAAEKQLLKLAETDHAAVLAEGVAVYRDSKDPEVRVRLRMVMETVVEKNLFRVPRAYLGVFLAESPDVPGAVVFTSISADTAAEKAGLLAKDVVIGVGTQKWETGTEGFREYVQSKRPGEKILLQFVRATKTNQLEIVLGALPEAQQEGLYSEANRQAFFDRWLEKNLAVPTPPAPK